LAEKIVSHSKWRLITGGAIGEGDGKTKGGVDFHAALGAQRFLNDPLLESQQILTILPHKEAKDVFKIGEVIIDEARNIQDRRKKLVARADAIITVEGGQGTIDIVRFAIGSSIPIIPLGGTGGKSKEVWDIEEFRNTIPRLLDISISDDCLRIIKEEIDLPELAVDNCLKIIEKIFCGGVNK